MHYALCRAALDLGCVPSAYYLKKLARKSFLLDSAHLDTMLTLRDGCSRSRASAIIAQHSTCTSGAPRHARRNSKIGCLEGAIGS